MAWTHCDLTIVDTDACPGCGLTKAEWSVKLDKTRTFSVPRTGRLGRRRDAWIEVQLVDALGAPVSGAAYRIGLPGGRVKTGELDAEGAVRVGELAEGPCEVSFPDLLPEPQERETGARHVVQLDLPLFVPSL